MDTAQCRILKDSGRFLVKIPRGSGLMNLKLSPGRLQKDPLALLPVVSFLEAFGYTHVVSFWKLWAKFHEAAYQKISLGKVYCWAKFCWRPAKPSIHHVTFGLVTGVCYTRIFCGKQICLLTDFTKLVSGGFGDKNYAELFTQRSNIKKRVSTQIWSTEYLC